MQLSELQLLADMRDLCILLRAHAPLTLQTTMVCEVHVVNHAGGRVLTVLKRKHLARHKGRHAGASERQACFVGMRARPVHQAVPSLCTGSQSCTSVQAVLVMLSHM